VGRSHRPIDLDAETERARLLDAVTGLVRAAHAEINR